MTLTVQYGSERGDFHPATVTGTAADLTRVTREHILGRQGVPKSARPGHDEYVARLDFDDLPTPDVSSWRDAPVSIAYKSTHGAVRILKIDPTHAYKVTVLASLPAPTDGAVLTTYNAPRPDALAGWQGAGASMSAPPPAVNGASVAPYAPGPTPADTARVDRVRCDACHGRGSSTRGGTCYACHGERRFTAPESTLLGVAMTRLVKSGQLVEELHLEPTSIENARVLAIYKSCKRRMTDGKPAFSSDPFDEELQAMADALVKYLSI
jgi:hypothetical protein